ncbi:hypothetical protein PRIPAC_88402 [Pristionchus pacificus]|uniref:HLH domain containing protein n=1 Tax=Pristionchus pacificus TaxID=54126 RepID=A0A2A6CWE7_PRIPA|nr:hypothetical protein PRIPAC_88402 [Pristionchus pacificus]|eukprot:PDM82564.1 HLH domain containing protein [Pristionchus pacificus]
MNVAVRKRKKAGEISRNGLKNQAYRDRMSAAFNSLRIALWAEPNEQWRSEKIHIVGGAIKFIQKKIGGISEISSNSASSDKAIRQEIDKLKKLLLEHCKEAHARMTVPALLTTAAEYIKSSSNSVSKDSSRFYKSGFFRPWE